MGSPIPVAMQGWSISSVLLAVLNVTAGGGILGALAVWLRTRPKMREVNLTGEEQLRTDLIARVQKLETDISSLTTLREAERAEHEAEMTIMRHRVNNSDQCLDALLLLLKTAPEKVDQAVQHIEAMRARQREEIAIERGAQVGAKAAASATPLIA